MPVGFLAMAVGELARALAGKGAPSLGGQRLHRQQTERKREERGRLKTFSAVREYRRLAAGVGAGPVEQGCTAWLPAGAKGAAERKRTQRRGSAARWPLGMRSLNMQQVDRCKGIP